MICQSCHRAARAGLCGSCRRTLTPAPDRVLPGGMLLRAAHLHEGAARALVHDLKYRGIGRYAEMAAAALAPRLPVLPLVPIPRVWSRTLVYGVDPSAVLARCLADLLDVPVLDLLARPIHTPRRAGRKHRSQVVYRTKSLESGSDLVLVDDVVTTGATVLAAGSALGMGRIRMVAAANVMPALPNPTPELKRLGLI